MHYSLELITAPSAEPMTTAEAKSHLRVDLSDDDDLIDSIVKAAREKLEVDTGRALITQTFDLHLDVFPDDCVIKVPRPTLQSITSIKYLDPDGVEQTLDASKYRIDSKSTPARIIPAYGESWPSIRATTNAVVVRCIAGYGDASTDIPQDLIQAMKLLVGHYYENREDVITGTIATAIPQAYEWLKAPHKVFSL